MMHVAPGTTLSIKSSRVHGTLPNRATCALWRQNLSLEMVVVVLQEYEI